MSLWSASPECVPGPLLIPPTSQRPFREPIVVSRFWPHAVQVSEVVSVDYCDSHAAAVGTRHTCQQGACRRCNGFAEILGVRTKREVGKWGIDDTDRERSGCARIHIHKNSQMILQLAEHVETATRNAQQEDRTTGLYERPPGTLICAAHVRVETIGDDRVTPGAQYDSEAFTERSDASGVLHQCRLNRVVSLDPSAIVKERIGWGGGVKK